MSILIGSCESQYEIQDFNQTASQRSPRYAAMIMPIGNRDSGKSEVWASSTLIDPTITGDPRASRRAVYCSGGITGAQLDLRPSNSEVRNMDQS